MGSVFETFELYEMAGCKIRGVARMVGSGTAVSFCRLTFSDLANPIRNFSSATLKDKATSPTIRHSTKKGERRHSSSLIPLHTTIISLFNIGFDLASTAACRSLRGSLASPCALPPSPQRSCISPSRRRSHARRDPSFDRGCRLPWHGEGP